MRKVEIFPNLLTMGNLCCGLLAIVHLFDATPESMVWAGRLILTALVFDALDGHVARLTKSVSNFGVNFDSLADLTTFGVAPAMLAYRMAFPLGDQIGVALVVIYAGCTALRLARFNSTATIKGKKPDFVGLPCPAAAAAVASLSMCAMKFNLTPIPEQHLGMPIAVSFLLLLSGLMVSKFPYPTAQRLGMAGAKPFNHLVIALLLLGLAAKHLSIAVFLGSMTYVGIGIKEELLRRRKKERRTETAEEPQTAPVQR